MVVYSYTEISDLIDLSYNSVMYSTVPVNNNAHHAQNILNN